MTKISSIIENVRQRKLEEQISGSDVSRAAKSGGIAGIRSQSDQPPSSPTAGSGAPWGTTLNNVYRGATGQLGSQQQNASHLAPRLPSAPAPVAPINKSAQQTPLRMGSSANMPQTGGGISGTAGRNDNSPAFLYNRGINAIRTATGIKGSRHDIRTQNSSVPEKGWKPEYKDMSQKPESKAPVRQTPGNDATSYAAAGRGMSMMNARKSAATAADRSVSVNPNVSTDGPNTQGKAGSTINQNNSNAQTSGVSGPINQSPQQKSSQQVLAKKAEVQSKVAAKKSAVQKTVRMKSAQKSRPMKSAKRPTTSAWDDTRANIARSMGQLEEEIKPQIKESFERFIRDKFS
jgi:cell pole-organizing protein PopZ